MTFSHCRESVASLKDKFDSGKYNFYLFKKGDKEIPGTKITNFQDIIDNILEDNGYEIGYDFTPEEVERIRENYSQKPATTIHYSWKYHNIEIVISTDEKGELTTPEVICWQEDESKNRSCYVLALWEKNSEGWEIRFIGDRPFTVFEDDWGLEIEKLWKGIEGCQKILNALFEVTRNV